MDALLIYKDRKFVGKLLLRGRECILGRGGDIVLNSPMVSRRHASIRRRGDRWLLKDLGSSNGTLLNRKPLPAANAEEPIRSGDLIEIGEFQLRCLLAPTGERGAADLSAEPEELARPPLPPIESMEATVRRLRPVEAPRTDEEATAPAQPVLVEPEAAPTPRPEAADESTLDGVPPFVEAGAAAAPKAAAEAAATEDTVKLGAPPAPPPAGAGGAVAREQVRRAKARLVISNEEVRNRVFIDELESRVGRTPDNDVAIGHASVSSKHAMIRFVGDGFAVVDHGSMNHTFVNGSPILPESPVRLEENAAVVFGAVSCLFVCDPSALPGRPGARRATDDAALQHLVEAGAITRVQAKEAMREAAEKDCSLGEMVVLRGFLSPEAWADACRAVEAQPGAAPRRSAFALAIAAAVGALLLFGALVALGVVDLRGAGG